MENNIQEKFVKMDRNNIEAYTPEYAVDILLPYLDRTKTIWAPFSRNEHNFANYLRKLGYKVINTHFDPETGVGVDFLTTKPTFHFDLIVDNPPFKGKTKFVERAFKLGKPFALFLPINAFGDNGIPNLFIENRAKPQLLIPDKRTEFENQENKGISFKTVYICKDVLPEQIIFTKLNKAARTSVRKAD
jgi:hypothetical protein